jgi:hypothetical protein
MTKVGLPKMRKEFESLIYQLGYRNRYPISLKQRRESTKIAKECFPKSINYIEFFVIHYHNKKSYLYEEYLKDRKKLSKYDLIKKYKYLLKKINYGSGRISEIGWQIMWDRNPQLLTPNQHKKILYRVIREFKFMRESKKYFTKADPYQILISKPWGNQLYNSLDTKDNFDLTRKRSLVNSKFGFGELDEYGCEYAMFDETLYLNPI